MRTATPCLEIYPNPRWNSGPVTQYVYAIHDEKRDCTKFGESNAPARRLAELRKQFGEHLELEATWAFPGGDAYEVEQHTHRVIGRASRVGHHASEWFRMTPDSWDFISTYLDRASDEIFSPGDAQAWIAKAEKEAAEKERLAKEEHERQLREEKWQRKQRAEAVLQRLSQDERQTVDDYFLQLLLDALQSCFSNN